MSEQCEHRREIREHRLYDPLPGSLETPEIRGTNVNGLTPEAMLRHPLWSLAGCHRTLPWVTNNHLTVVTYLCPIPARAWSATITDRHDQHHICNRQRLMDLL
jgi:hypothetical protein